MTIAAAIHIPIFNGDALLPRTPPTATMRTAVSVRRRVQPAVMRFAAPTISSRSLIGVSTPRTGVVADAINGANVAAPAYEGHKGPFDDKVLTAAVPAPIAPSDRPSLAGGAHPQQH